MMELVYQNGLIPAIVQDVNTKQVLMLAYMNEESLQKSLDEGYTCFYSRSRKTLWKKGETSGHVQKIRAIKTDCDRDTLLIEVEQEGPACHTGSPSCFFETLQADAGEEDTFTYEKLYDKLMGRKRDLPENSYTTYLFEKGLDKILKKVGEECTEVIIAAKDNDRAEMIYEIGDLLYHLTVLMIDRGITLEDIKKELAGRDIEDVKVKQEKMR